MVNPTYKHLEASLRLGTFTLGQWAQVISAAVVALLFGIYLSPLPITATIFVSVLMAGLPLAVSYGAMGLDFSLAQMARAALRFWREPRHHLPGPGSELAGYRVHQAPLQLGPAPEVPEPAGASGEALWDW